MDEKDNVSHSDILGKVQENSHAISDIHSDIKEIKKQVSPIREFFDDIDTAARLGRSLRSIVGWLVVVGGFVAMIWIVIADAIRT